VSQPSETAPPGGWPPPPGWTQPPAQVAPSPPSAPPAGGPGMTLPPGWAPQPPEYQPGVIPLRPLSVGDLFSGTFATMRGHWRALLVVAASVAAAMSVVAIPILLAGRPVARALAAVAVIDPGAPSGEAQAALNAFGSALVDFAPWLLLVLMLQVMAVVIIEAGCAIVVGRAVLGQPIPVAEVMSQLRGLMPRLVLLGLLMAVSISVGLLLCIIPGILLTYLWFGAPSALALEKASPTTALRRSARLVGGSFWRVVGILLLVQIVYGIAIQIVSVPVSVIASAGVLGATSQALPSSASVNLMLFGYFGAAVVWLLTYPLVAAARVLEYLDLRMRREGLADTLIVESRN